MMGTNTTLANEFLPTDINHNSSIIEEPTNPGMNAITPVSELSDVSAEDWAFQALRSGDLIPTVNPLFSGSGDGSISTFGRENPIRRQGEGAGIGISQNLGESVNLALGYVAIDANEADNGILGNDTYAAIAQLTWQPNEFTSLSFTYARSSNSFNTGTGSELTSDPFNRDAEDVRANSFAAEASIRVNPGFILGGRVGLIQAQAKDLPNQPNANIFTWAIYVGTIRVTLTF
ncbi:hypothetical protein [Coleofasciculus sp. F4-SAH-05]|uniref:hypothetical protein n=1 Tax=Coleofasciculus sp. F4-SAH-05 TaxID=3069525 RepID=UPI004063DAB4